MNNENENDGLPLYPLTYRNQQNEEVGHPLEKHLDHKQKVMILCGVDLILQRLRYDFDEVDGGFRHLIDWMNCSN